MLTQERVKELFEYKDGDLIRKIASGCYKKGSIAGSQLRGYVRTGVDGFAYFNHRLIWLWCNGYFPENQIDHIDRDKSNNKIENLREVSRTCNLRNTGLPSTNTSGVKGVFWHKQWGKWAARITICRNHIHLKYSTDFTEAVAHRLAAEQAEGWAGCDSSSTAFEYMQEYINK